MTERERWVVYPLLFLALGAALRDKLSEHTKTKTLECQELIVYGESSAGQPAVPLVQIGGRKRTSADSPHLGEIIVNGLVHAFGVEAESMQASKINADSYYFQRVPFAPLMRTIPGVSPADRLRALQLQQQAMEAEKNSAPQEPPPPNDRSDATEQPASPAEAPASSSDTTSPAK